MAVVFLYWLTVSLLSIPSDVSEVNELYDIHLTHTSLALLRLSDPIVDQVFTVTGDSAANTIEQLFKKWPDLPDRIQKPDTTRNGSPEMASAKSSAADEEVVSKNIAYGKSLRYQIWHSDGRLIFRSANAPLEPITQILGFSNSPDIHGDQWRHYSIWDRSHTLRVIVSESSDMRAQQVRSLAFSAISPIAIGLPVLIILLWLSIKRGLMPLTDLSRAIASRKSDSLAYFQATNTPWELQPVVLALNDLLKRVTRMLEGERRFTDNAAHELRTPLAAIDAHLFAACNANNAAEREASVHQARLGVTRGMRLVGQMLTLARLEPSQIQPDFVPVQMGEMAKSVCADLAPLALARDQTLELIAQPDLPAVMGNMDMLSMLLSNLVDNAIRYTRRGGHIIVMAKPINGALLLAVNDDGPGIPPEQREHVFQRFYRLADQKLPGTGLGLAICRSIADLHHAQISLSDTPTGTGLCVKVVFPK